MSCKGLKALLGHTVTGIMVKEGDSSPSFQVLLALESGHVYEFYTTSGPIHGTWLHGTAGLDTARQYLTNKRILEVHSQDQP